MKTWFIYLIDGKRVGTWANNTEEAEGNLAKEYGDVEMKYIGNTCHNHRIEMDGFISVGMSAVDKMIAYGLVDLFAGLR